MRLLVIGATGLTGRQIVKQALEAGHEVTAFVRNPAAFTDTHECLRLHRGDVSDAQSVAEGVKGQDAVLCAVGPRSNRSPGTVISDAARNLVAAMSTSGGQRLAFQSGMMVGDIAGASALNRALVKFFGALNGKLRDDKRIAERLVRESTLDWVIVRPPVIAERPARNSYRAQENVPLSLATMSAVDVAHAMLRAATDAAWSRKEIELSY